MPAVGFGCVLRDLRVIKDLLPTMDEVAGHERRGTGADQSFEASADGQPRCAAPGRGIVDVLRQGEDVSFGHRWLLQERRLGSATSTFNGMHAFWKAQRRYHCGC